MSEEETRDLDASKAKASDGEFDRQKWETETSFRERELKLKENEGRPSILRNAIFMSVAAGVGGLILHTAGDFSTQWMQRTDDSRHQQSALIQKALEHEDPLRVLAKLKLLNELKLVPAYSEGVTALLADPDSANRLAFVDSGRQYQAALIQKATENDDRAMVLKKLQFLDEADLIPDYGKISRIRDVLRDYRGGAPPPISLAPPPPITPPVSMTPPREPPPLTDAPSAASARPQSPPPPAGTTSTTSAQPPPVDATPAASAQPPSPPTFANAAPTIASSDSCSTAATNRAPLVGWIFLGMINEKKSEWVPSESGTGSVQFESGLPESDPKLMEKLKSVCLHTTVAKFLREDGAPGLKVHAGVKRTLHAGTRLKIVDIDAKGIDAATSNPAVWAKVEVLSE
jgi:hypothetical protein